MWLVNSEDCSGLLNAGTFMQQFCWHFRVCKLLSQVFDLLIVTAICAKIHLKVNEEKVFGGCVHSDSFTEL